MRNMPRSECRNNQAGEHEIDTHELHGRRHGEREQRVETKACQAVAHPVPGEQHKGADDRNRQQLFVVHPEYLANKQLFEVLAAVRVAGEQQDARRRCEDESDPDKCFLYRGPALVGPVQNIGSKQRRRNRGYLNHPALCLPAHRIGRDDTQSGHLRDGQIDKNYAPPQHLGSEWNMGAQYQQARNERRDNNTQLEFAHCRYSSRIAIVRS